jgi:DNA-directed RNA polymerase beta subunit
MMQLKRGEWGFNDFLRNGLVEYLDVNEENNALIALYEKNIGAYLTLWKWHAHCMLHALHPSMQTCAGKQGLACDDVQVAIWA